MKMYNIFLSVFLKQKWALGAFVWHYEIDRHAGKTWRIDGYTPQDKPAQWVMKRYFKKFCG